MSIAVATFLEQYNLQSAPTTVMRDLGNLVLRVDAEKTYALRICTPDTSRQRLHTEVEWLAALRRDTDLLVPKPVANRRGNLVSEVEGRLCVLFEWLEGSPVSDSLSTTIASAIGEMAAKLHHHALHYHPTHYEGKRFNHDYFFGNDSWWQLRAEQHLGGDTIARLQPALARVSTLIKSLGEDPKHFGIIHSDIHFSNVISSGDHHAIIDFGECALGYYLMDIALTENEFRDYEEGEAFITAFRHAYEATYGSFPDPAHIRQVQVLSDLLFLEWVFESPNPKVREQKMQWVESTLENISVIA